MRLTPARSDCVLPVARTLCWGTREEAERLDVAGQGTRKWAYRWIEEHIKHLSPSEILADIGGGGVDSALCHLLAPHSQEVLVLDRLSEGRSRGNIREVHIDFEEGLGYFADASVDVFVSASAIEHLTAAGQRLIFAEVSRALKPGGVFCGTVSYIARLDEDVIRLIQSDPVFEQTGSAVHCAFDAKACLQNAPRLGPEYPPVAWRLFPGFDGFDEGALLDNQALISDVVGSYGTVRVAKEIDALRLPWYEMGLFLRKER